MDFMEKITELRAQKKALADQANALVEEGKLDGLDAITDQMEGINKDIQALERNLEASRAGAEPVGGYDGLLHDGKKGSEPKDGARPFASLGEQLQAIVAVAKSHTADKRLIQVNNAVLGANEGTGADGGFALQEDFAGTIIESAVQHSQLLNRLDRYRISWGEESGMRQSGAFAGGGSTAGGSLSSRGGGDVYVTLNVDSINVQGGNEDAADEIVEAIIQKLQLALLRRGD